ncbi:ABC transporter substrate-binding protein [Trebonia kvetii]|uniref:ABC transporter substrate-binding protein n=1 Tax=Trebonia kvetii TaxID=2480626 RepID=A0A6P2BX93_9ACTN|nr:ABC transporter substrate-binding protein [Trebonia kvetii]
MTTAALPIAATLAAVSVAACSSGSSSTAAAPASTGASASASTSASGSASASAPSYASGKTASIVLPSDPGSLDPQLAYISDALEVDYFLYDSLINFTPSGQVESNLATNWSGNSTSASYTLKQGVTCSDGSPLTASTVAANINFIANPKNASSRLGTWAPPGATATGNDKTGVVTVKSPAPDPFLVSDVGQALIVCGNGMKDRGSLKNGADGTGMYTLSSAVPGSSYTLTLRKGYTWGPGDATSATVGLPATVSLKVVSNMTTAANELLSGQANISQVVGSDTQRLTSLYSQSVYAPLGELWFNEKPGSPTADVAVRRALTQAVQLSQLGQVLSSGSGKPATGAIAPALSPCKGNTIGSNLPAFDLSAAKSALAGKKLTVALYYPTSLGAGATAAATLLQQTWSQLGVTVTLHGITDAEISSEIVAGTADWNVGIIPLGLTSPTQLVSFVSGATPPKGADFAYINNHGYTAAVTKASATPGQAGCASWNAAETDLYKNVDLVPFVNTAITSYANGATFQLSQGSIMPSSIRMLG